MCGRYTLTSDADELVEAFDVPHPTFEWQPRYNIAPGQAAPVVAQDARGRRMGLLTWGLVPGWMDAPGRGFINARSESARSKPSFRKAFDRRRCLVAADGFYEWERTDGRGVPYWFHPPDGSALAFAGLWERWSRPGAEPRHTFTILTTEASPDVRGVHDRMPVVLPRSRWDLWLDMGGDQSALVGLLVPPPEGTFAARPVSTRVNRSDADDPELIEAVG
jgi:putative SOS response-associated peptidase YedK